ncbi:MAG: DUF3134 family protein [Leptolyngbyaceae cyanobacterium RM1_406_9]|nr:DUF3134 family protein [Leptolyngbyaceae cyanobacterium RM1_406_9]
MVIRYNPALREEPRNQPTKIAPLIPRESLLSWLESTGRFRANEDDEPPDHRTSEDLDDILEPEIFSPAAEEEE